MRPTLTARLVASTVVLVLVVSALVAAATAIAMRDYLTSRLDEDVRRGVRIFAAQGDSSVPPAPPEQPDSSASARPEPTNPDPTNPDPTNPDLGPRPGARPGFGGRNQGPGTLNVIVTEGSRQGRVLGETPGEFARLGRAALDTIAALPHDDSVRTVTIDEGSFRVASRAVRLSQDGAQVDGYLYTGLPTDSVDAAVSSLIRWEAAFIVLGVMVATCTGTLVVRRQLRPLRSVAATAHAVAELPLARGEIGLLERVPAKLTDERTEVGQVGAALNTLLGHVEHSLEARQRSEEQVRQFVADASHELRTPLTTIRGYAELAQRRPETAEQALAKVTQESIRMSALVEDLLLLARLDAGRPLVMEPVDLTRVVLETVMDAQIIAPTHRWVVNAPDLPVLVLGDEQRLRQAVLNLVTNAHLHTPAGTTVTAEVNESGFAVSDDGPGFGEEFDPFERFSRADTARSREADSGTGVGLGMALVKAIVNAHGGEIAVTSWSQPTRVDVRLVGVEDAEPTSS